MSQPYRVIFHLDMDAFYASIEQRDFPEHRGRPVIVGASPVHRGVVCAASYEARAFGVHSAMPSVIAVRLCPNAVFVQPRMARYREESKKIMKIVEATGAKVEQVSIDEAYLDLSQIVTGQSPDNALLNSVQLARRLKETIRNALQLAASIGIAGNKMLAKLASDYGKPDGLLLITERDKILFLKDLPVDRIHGVGRVTARRLKALGIETIGQLQSYPGDLRPVAGSWSHTLRRYALGEDTREVQSSGSVKVVSSERTFSQDTEDRNILRQALRDQADELGSSLQRKKLRARTIQVKVRYGNFETLTRQLSVENPVQTSRELYRFACHLLARHRLVKAPLRLLGLGVFNLVEGGWSQLEFQFPGAASPLEN
ncbi:MAG: DNA polymerase IV [Verrucomicrobia subdivision 3 bacterium]|nr:DNA polymerase IV [Limisphaerales bacterium]MCS1413025.1 DNA polymerase IV [Limisphaerales bacterium]